MKKKMHGKKVQKSVAKVATKPQDKFDWTQASKP